MMRANAQQNSARPSIQHSEEDPEKITGTISNPGTGRGSAYGAQMNTFEALMEFVYSYCSA